MQSIALPEGKIRGRSEATICLPKEESEPSFRRNQQTAPTEPCQGLRRGSGLHPFKIPVDHVFSAMKDQDEVRRPGHSHLTRRGREPENTALFMTEWDTIPLIVALSGDNSMSY